MASQAVGSPAGCSRTVLHVVLPVLRLQAAPRVQPHLETLQLARVPEVLASSCKGLPLHMGSNLTPASLPESVRRAQDRRGREKLSGLFHLLEGRSHQKNAGALSARNALDSHPVLHHEGLAADDQVLCGLSDYRFRWHSAVVC